MGGERRQRQRIPQKYKGFLLVMKLNQEFKNSQQKKGLDETVSQVNSLKHVNKSSYVSFLNYSKKLKRKACFQT